LFSCLICARSDTTMSKACWYLITLLVTLQLAACTSVQVGTGSSAQATPSTSGSSKGSYGTPPPTTGQESELEQQLFALINKDRADQGLYPYTSDTTLAKGARLHSWNMAHCGLTHACPGEPDPCQRVTNEGVHWTSCGENVGYTSPYPTASEAVQKIEQDMLNEPPPAG